MKLFFLILLHCLSLQASTVYTTSILDTSKNESPYLAPIRAGDFPKVNALIKAGHDVNRKGIRDETPFMAAVYKGDIRIIKALYAAGGDLNSTCKWGNTPLMFAFYGTKQKKSAVALLLSFKPHLEVKNHNQLTPLMLATLNNHTESIKLLIEAGAEIEAQERQGMTPLHLAADNQNIEPAKILLECGANIEARTLCTFTPLMLAALRNDAAMVKLLLNAGANPDARTTRIVKVEINGLPQSKSVQIPLCSTALDIARLFQQPAAQKALSGI